MYWFPLYGAHFNGSEGDLFLMLKGKNKATSIRRIMIWHPDMADLKSPVTWQKQKLTLPKTIDTGLPMVIVPVDTAGNTGYPNPVIDGKMLQSSTAEPMTVLLPDVIPAETSEADKK
jgi:hypothetical protein